MNLILRGSLKCEEAVGIELRKFEAKKGDFAKILQKLREGAGFRPTTPAPPYWINLEKLHDQEEKRQADPLRIKLILVAPH